MCLSMNEIALKSGKMVYNKNPEWQNVKTDRKQTVANEGKTDDQKKGCLISSISRFTQNTQSS